MAKANQLDETSQITPISDLSATLSKKGTMWLRHDKSINHSPSVCHLGGWRFRGTLVVGNVSSLPLWCNWVSNGTGGGGGSAGLHVGGAWSHAPGDGGGGGMTRSDRGNGGPWAWCVHGHPWAKGKAGPGQAHKMKAEAPAGDCQDPAQCPRDVVAR